MPALTENKVTFKSIQSSMLHFPQITYFFKLMLWQSRNTFWKLIIHETAIGIIALCVLKKNLLLVGEVISVWHSLFHLHCHSDCKLDCKCLHLTTVKTAVRSSIWKISATAFTMTSTLTNYSVVVTFTDLDNQYLNLNICMNFECSS